MNENTEPYNEIDDYMLPFPMRSVQNMRLLKPPSTLPVSSIIFGKNED